MKSYVLASAAAMFVASSAMAGDLLWDNGDWDPNMPDANGISSILSTEFDRAVLSDVTFDTAVNLTGFQFDGFWQFAQTAGTGVRLWLRGDNGGTPGDIITELTTTNYNESLTGGTAFNRPIARSAMDITGADNIAAGTYWLEWSMEGPAGDNYFHLTSYGSNNLLGEQFWFRYGDFGNELLAGDNLTGSPVELNFKLFGTVVPTPGALALLGLAGLASRRRRRA